MTPACKTTIFWLVMVVLLLLAVELLCRLSVYVIVKRTTEQIGRGVNLLEFFSGDIYAGYRMPGNECEEFEVGAKAEFKFWEPGAPKWRVCTNRYGFRGRDFDFRKAGGALRIVCMGDSSTLGIDVNDDETFCALLPVRLSELGFKRSAKIEALNLGVWGYSSFQGLITYETFIKKNGLKPDIALIAYGANDQLPLERLGKRFPDSFIYRLPGEGELIFSFGAFEYFGVIKVFHLSLNAARSLYSVKRRTPGGFSERVTLDEFRANILGIIRLAREDSAMPILVSFIGEETEYKRALFELGNAEGVPVVDVFNVFGLEIEKVRKEGEYSGEREEIEKYLKRDEKYYQYLDTKYSPLLTTDGYHPGKIGHKIVAEEIAKVVINSHK